MIKGNINDLVQYQFLSTNEKLKAALNYIKEGKYIQEEGIKDTFHPSCTAFINKLNTRSFNHTFEAHNKNIDIFYVIKGYEEVYVGSRKEATIKEEYIEEKDILFLESNIYQKTILQEGDYIILFPEDIHAPGIGDGSYLEKLVIKVKVV